MPATSSTAMTDQTERVDLDSMPWHVRLTVVWRGEELPVPIAPEASEITRTAGVRLATRPGSCVAHFTIRAVSARAAVPNGLDFWASVVEKAGLPRWEVVSFSVDQIDPHDVTFVLAEPDVA